ncbi:uncharacterized protein ARMOST_16355 [Armillaria ostoyae]|uniref:Uncharacterized protein n=1 Tax=Armillaria ostoyae TaxID=47428 RepID=A0A284RVY8_ARMOS|nr:uncharacterized protein ARMOST_16355 [Armillaria ostoyae]
MSVLVFTFILWPWVGKIKGRFNFDFGAFRAAKGQGKAKRIQKLSDGVTKESHLRRKDLNSERGPDLKRFVSSTQTKRRLLTPSLVQRLRGRREHSCYAVTKRHADRIWEAAKRDGCITCAYERLVLGSIVVLRLKAAGIKTK